MSKIVKIKIENRGSQPNPTYTHKGDAGMDLRANEDTVIYPQNTAIIDTGIAVSIPEGYEIQIRSRSGLAAVRQVSVLNSPGTIDSNYRDTIKIILRNNSSSHFSVQKGDRIAQMVLNEIPTIKWVKVKTLEENKDRGKKGLGSSGVS